MPADAAASRAGSAAGRLSAGCRRAWRLPWLVGLLLGGLATVLLVFPLMAPARRDATVAGWSRWLVRACGVRLNVEQPGGAGVTPLPLRPGGRMLVANHVSWLDIFVINALAPSWFIAKADIASWPLIGTLVGRTGTIFLERGKRHAVHEALHKVAAHLSAGRRIAVFPEGTTGAGDTLMPFHANLIQAAVQAQVPVDPVGVHYRGLRGESVGGETGAMYFVGEISFVESLWRITGAPGVSARLCVLAEIAAEPQPDNRSRHRVAGAARQAISDALGLPLQDTLPETVRHLRAGRL